MNVLLLLGAAGLLAVYSVSMKFIKGDSLRFTVFVTAIYSGLIAAVCVALYIAGGFVGNPITVRLGILWGIGCVVTQTAYFVAMQSGPLSYTVFIFSASMMIPALGSALVWKEMITGYQWIGMVLFLAAFYLVGIPGTDKGKGAKKWWPFLCFLAFFSNGVLNMIVKAEQIAVGGEHTLPMLTFSYGSMAVTALVLYIALGFFRKEIIFPREICAGIKKTWIPIVSMAFSNGVANGLVAYLSSRVPGAWLYPCVLGGNMILVTIFSVTVLKEKINRAGMLGLIVGALAMFVMNV